MFSGVQQKTRGLQCFQGYNRKTEAYNVFRGTTENQRLTMFSGV